MSYTIRHATEEGRQILLRCVHFHILCQLARIHFIQFMELIEFNMFSLAQCLLQSPAKQFSKLPNLSVVPSPTPDRHPKEKSLDAIHPSREYTRAD